MQCLRCPNDAIPGKALCESCFAKHQKKAEFEETDDWVKQQLEETRNQSRERQRESSGGETSPQSLVLTLAPALLAMGGFLMFSVWAVRNWSFTFTPTPETEQVEGVPVGSIQKGAEANSAKSPGSVKPSGTSQSSGATRGFSDNNPPSEQPQAAPTPSPIPTSTPEASPSPSPTATPEGSPSPDSTPTP